MTINLDLLFAILFYGVILLWFFKQRDRFEVQGKIIALYKTKIGLREMDWLANLAPRFTNILGHIGIVVGFLGMGFIFYFLVKGTAQLLFVPDAMPAVAPVLPGIRVPGLPVLSFWHWILGIFFVAVVHEFSHGIWARLYKMKVKSSGFLFLGPVLGAFVEPDEKELVKRPKRHQLAVFAAGPFSNVIFGILFLLLMNFVTGPFYQSLYEGVGVEVNKVMEEYPAAQANLEPPFVIQEINGKKTTTFEHFVNATRDITPGSAVHLVTDKGTHDITAAANPDNTTKGFIGVADFSFKTEPKAEVIEKYGSWFPPFYTWIHMLIFWLVVINFGIGLFNLLPLGPIDGGRMFLTAMLALCKNDKKKATKIWSFVSFFCLALIFINLAPYLWKLLLWLVKPLVLLGAFFW